MTTAVMQPYIFPYLGYFQLVHAVDHFVFYDDVNFIKGGWINRNRICVNGEAKLFTIPLSGSSSNKKINEISVFRQNKDVKKILKAIKFEYAKAPFFESVYPWLEEIFIADHYNSIAAMAGDSVIKTAEYLGLETKFYYSSMLAPDTLHLSRSKRLIAISKKLNSNQYINSIGGKELYNKEDFELDNIKLNFLSPSITNMNSLSIIDSIMNNSVEEINNHLVNFTLK